MNLKLELIKAKHEYNKGCMPKAKFYAGKVVVRLGVDHSEARKLTAYEMIRKAEELLGAS